MKKWDVIIILILLFIGCSTFIYVNYASGKGQEAVIYLGDKIYGRYSLANDEQIIIENEDNYNEIIIENHSVHMNAANCANRICVNQGCISNEKEVICCAPNHIVIVIEGQSVFQNIYNNEGDYDAISR